MVMDTVGRVKGEAPRWPCLLLHTVQHCILLRKEQVILVDVSWPCVMFCLQHVWNLLTVDD